MEQDKAEKVVDMFAKAIADKHDGTPPLINTVTCMEWKLNGHANCIGCESQFRCDKLATLLLIDLTVRMGEANRIGLDTTKSGFSVMECMVDIVRAKDEAELNNVLPSGLKRDEI